jgi:hypothetical protein
MFLLGLLHCRDGAEKHLSLYLLVSQENYRKWGLNTMEGNVGVVFKKKHDELLPNETNLKPVNIFKDTTQITKWFHFNSVIMKQKEQY